MANSARDRWDAQPEATNLTEEELATYLRLQQKVGWRRTGTPVFESLYPIVPFVPCELAVVRQIRGFDHILLWHRADVHYDGWHMPGGYLLRGEREEEWIQRVLAKETGMELISHYPIRTFNTRPDTAIVPNHQMAHFFFCETTGEPSVGEFFPLGEIPSETLCFHRWYVECLRAHLIRLQTMQGNDGIRHDHKKKAPERMWRVVHNGISKDIRELDQAVRSCQYIRWAEGGVVFLVDDQGHQIL